MNEVLAFSNDGVIFEERGQSNGGKYWFARDFMAMLGYEHFNTFEQGAINRAIGTLTTLGIPVAENFLQCQTTVDGESVADYKLSRFACYLVAMNGDVRKPAVAAAQMYFATLAEAAREYMQAVQDVERVQIRDDISERERGLSSTAKAAGVTEYPLFQNAGYRGMYNMDLGRLKRTKGLEGARSLLDFMGKRELAGNLFRITETEAKLTSEHTRGQQAAENVAFAVGRKVRSMMSETDGTKPELLPIEADINKVKTGLKKTAKEFTKLDTPRPTTRKRLPPS